MLRKKFIIILFISIFVSLRFPAELSIKIDADVFHLADKVSVFARQEEGV
jgi:hypothetical protein